MCRPLSHSRKQRKKDLYFICSYYGGFLPFRTKVGGQSQPKSTSYELHYLLLTSFFLHQPYGWTEVNQFKIQASRPLMPTNTILMVVRTDNRLINMPLNAKKTAFSWKSLSGFIFLCDLSDECRSVLLSRKEILSKGRQRGEDSRLASRQEHSIGTLLRTSVVIDCKKLLRLASSSLL